MDDRISEKPWLQSIRDLKLSYRKTHRMLQRAKLNVSPDLEKGLDEMISDVNYAIEWMHTGKQPGNKRGIERRSTYQREKLMDPLRMQAFMQAGSAGSPANISEWQRFQIEDALSNLSPIERDCFEMAVGRCIPHSEIASLMGVSKGNIATILKRAQKKIVNNKLNSLFLQE